MIVVTAVEYQKEAAAGNKNVLLSGISEMSPSPSPTGPGLVSAWFGAGGSFRDWKCQLPVQVGEAWMVRGYGPLRT